jgi:hypothetical protein
MRGLTALGGLLLIVGILAVWVKRVVLETPTWTDTSSRILQDPTVQQTLSTYVVDQLYANVDVAARLRGVLPEQAQPLAAPAAAGQREFIGQAALRTLQTDQVQNTWRAANRTASRELIRLIDGGGSRLQTTNGKVVLNLHPLVEQVAGRAGIGERVGTVLPANAGRITIVSSNELKLAQDGAKALRAAGYILGTLAILCFAGAIWLAPDRRRALRTCGIAVVCASLVLIFVRRVLGDEIIARLVVNEAFRPAAHSAWWIATDQLRLVNTTLLFVGVIALLGAWVAGQGEWAREVRLVLTPYLRERTLAYGALVAVALLLLAWSPTPATRSWYTGLVLLCLAVAGIEFLRRQAVHDFPDAERATISLPRPRPREEAPVAATAGAEDLLLARLTRLGDLRERGVLSEEEFAREKQGLLAGRVGQSTPSMPVQTTPS